MGCFPFIETSYAINIPLSLKLSYKRKRIKNNQGAPFFFSPCCDACHYNTGCKHTMTVVVLLLSNAKVVYFTEISQIVCSKTRIKDFVVVLGYRNEKKLLTSASMFVLCLWRSFFNFALFPCFKLWQCQ